MDDERPRKLTDNARGWAAYGVALSPIAVLTLVGVDTIYDRALKALGLEVQR